MIESTVMFKGDKAAILINAQAQPPRFKFRTYRAAIEVHVGKDIKALKLPDEASYSRIQQALSATPESVFVVEIAPSGEPLNEHSIEVID